MAGAARASLAEYRAASVVHRNVNVARRRSIVVTRRGCIRSQDPEPQRRTTMAEITRRTILSGGAAGGALALTQPLKGPAHASAPGTGKQVPGFYRYKVGDYEITAINDGLWNNELKDGFVKNAALPDVQKALEDAFQPANVVRIPFTALAVNTGSKLILLDTGTGGRAPFPTAGTYMDNLAAAGIDPKAVDSVVISHFHFDHINGLRQKDESLTFPNAEIQVSAPEWTYWMDDGKMSTAPDVLKGTFNNSRRIFGPVAKDVKQFEPGKEVAPGITSIAAHGHTPGHVAFAIASGNQSMLMSVDISNVPFLFVHHPEWQPAFDMDGAMAVETRKRLLDRAAADKMLVAGYHWPFPAAGYITRNGSGYQLHPVTWSHML
jgi:glyoxylase-like metal-dependent hydrolase (beta-lactamase superfamily II)